MEKCEEIMIMYLLVPYPAILIAVVSTDWSTDHQDGILNLGEIWFLEHLWVGVLLFQHRAVASKATALDSKQRAVFISLSHHELGSALMNAHA